MIHTSTAQRSRKQWTEVTRKFPDSSPDPQRSLHPAPIFTDVLFSSSGPNLSESLWEIWQEDNVCDVISKMK